MDAALSNIRTLKEIENEMRQLQKKQKDINFQLKKFIKKDKTRYIANYHSEIINNEKSSEDEQDMLNKKRHRDPSIEEIKLVIFFNPRK
jgi:hypothetical protein